MVVVAKVSFPLCWNVMQITGLVFRPVICRVSSCSRHLGIIVFVVSRMIVVERLVAAEIIWNLGRRDVRALDLFCMVAVTGD